MLFYTKKYKTPNVTLSMARYIHIISGGKLRVIGTGDTYIDFLCPEHGEFRVYKNEVDTYLYCSSCNEAYKVLKEKEENPLLSDNHRDGDEVRGMAYYGFDEDAYEGMDPTTGEVRKGWKKRVSRLTN